MSSPVVPQSVHRCFESDSKTLWFREYEGFNVFNEFRSVINTVACHLRSPDVIIGKFQINSFRFYRRGKDGCYEECCEKEIEALKRNANAIEVTVRSWKEGLCPVFQKS